MKHVFVRSALACAALLVSCLDRPVGEQRPVVSNVVVQQVPPEIDKVDLLFMIDNSVSMADKQSFFERAVPALVGRLVTPRCVNGDAVAAPLPGGACPEGHVPEFKSVRDIHLGIVSSSLGDYGSDQCDLAEQDDRARLIGSQPRGAVAGAHGLGFLAWDPDQQQGGLADAGQLIEAFRSQVIATGENGCGFEASLEAWYRFLIDPFPPAGVVVPNAASGDAWTDLSRDAEGRVVVDEVVLEQRRAFLRPDSLVAVIVLSDENDCSVRVPGFAAAVAAGGTLARASSSCATDPNDRCCRNCNQAPAAGCPSNQLDSECSKGNWSMAEDAKNLRCFEQKRRFGIDLLFPTARYAVGLTKARLCPESPYGDADCDCDFARETLGVDSCEPGPDYPNPLFTDLATGTPASRGPNLVYYAAIVGVPWQDLATEDTLHDPRKLSYMTATELEQAGRWDVILGDPARAVLPLDPFMQESVAPRTGPNPIVPAESLAPPDAPFMANSINGHEYLADDTLQHACIFPLPSELQRDCEIVGSNGCDCPASDTDRDERSPLCQDAAGYGSTQRYAKAFPGLRELDVAKRVGQNAIVASVCPKIIDELEPDFGYAPAVDAIVEALGSGLKAACLPRPLDRNPDGTLPCRAVEVSFDGAPECADLPPGRELTRLTDPELDRAVRAELERSGRCGQPGCSDACLGTLSELTGEARAACESGAQTGEVGYCYVDPDPPPIGSGIGSPELVEDCDATTRRMLRLVGPDTPRRGASVYIACAGRSFTGVD